MLSVMICLEAVAIAIKPEEHCLSIVIPETVFGKPAAIPPSRPMFSA